MSSEEDARRLVNRPDFNFELWTVQEITKLNPADAGSIVYIRYRDHVLYHRGDPAAIKPQVREAVGWLVYDCEDYVIICWDRDAGPPTLGGGDPKASGLVLLRSDILELRRLMDAR